METQRFTSIVADLWYLDPTPSTTVQDLLFVVGVTSLNTFGLRMEGPGHLPLSKVFFLSALYSLLNVQL